MKIITSPRNSPLLFIILQAWPLPSAEAPLRKRSAGVKFRGRRRREPLPETTPNMAAIRGSHFVTRVVCVLMSWKWRVFVPNCHVARCGRFTHENLPTCLEIGESLFISWWLFRKRSYFAVMPWIITTRMKFKLHERRSCGDKRVHAKKWFIEETSASWDQTKTVDSVLKETRASKLNVLIKAYFFLYSETTKLDIFIL